MSSPTVDVLLFRLGEHRVAVELQLVSSVLNADEARGMGIIDPRPFFYPPHHHASTMGELKTPRVGLLDIAGPPVVVILGEILGAATLSPAELLTIPPWLSNFLPPVLHPACAWIDQKVVWLLDLDTLKTTASL